MKKRCGLFALIVIMTAVFIFFSMASFANTNKHEGFTDKSKATFHISEVNSNPPERFHGTFHQRGKFKGNKGMDILTSLKNKEVK